jgi:N-acetylneuraminic acid mutarotase
MKKFLIVTTAVCYSLACASLLLAAPDTWTQKAEFGGIGQHYAVGFTIGSKGYIGMGREGSSNKEFWEYDPAANTWTRKADFAGTAQNFAVGFSIGNKGYIGTGWGGSGTYTNEFWEYDPVANTWIRKADFGGAARGGAVGFSIGSKGYIGMGSYGMPPTSIHLKDFWEYDPVADTWIRKADFEGTTRTAAVGFSIGRKGYIGTGVLSAVRISILYKDFWEYDPAADTWAQKADLGGASRYSAVGFSVGSKGYIGTGAGVLSLYLKDFWEYDPSTNTWTQRADFGGTARDGSVGFSIGDKGYIGTGHDGSSPRKDFWEYSTISTGSGGCFIATAAFGSHLDPHVIALREFRDDYLLTHPIGEALVGFYHKVSPPIAEYIAEHESLRTVVRLTLIPLVFVAKYPGLLFVFFLSILGFAAILVKRLKQRY